MKVTQTDALYLDNARECAPLFGCFVLALKSWSLHLKLHNPRAESQSAIKFGTSMKFEH